VSIDWPAGNPRDAPLSVMQRVVVEKLLMDYRVETAGGRANTYQHALIRIAMR
jgi:hypothetical protein